MELKQKKIAFILSTGSLNNDDRVRKEVITLIEEGDNIVDIYAKVNINKKQIGITEYGARYEYVYLKTRDLIPSAKGLVLKILELYLKLRKKLDNYDVIWCADEGMFIFPLLLSKKKCIIWDLHEIPSMFEMNQFTKWLFRKLIKKCTLIIHANKYRKDYLIQQQMIEKTSKHIIINNYPDKVFVNSPLIPETYNKIQSWLNNTPYVYLQGISDSSRYPFNSIAAILKATDYKVIITADKFAEDTENHLIYEFNNEYKSRVYFAGMLDQLLTPSIIKGAKFSMVFYKTNTPNNQYCEANRFYQPISFGVPIICGFNEPMREIINRYNCGITIENDGSDLGKIIEAIRLLCNNYQYYREMSLEANKNFIWDNSQIINLINNTLNS